MTSSTRRVTTWTETAVTAAHDSDGAAISVDSSADVAILRNIDWQPVEYRIGSGGWRQLQVRTSVAVSAGDSIRVRRTQYGAAGTVRLEIETVQGLYFAAGEVYTTDGTDVASAMGAGPNAMTLVVSGQSYQPTRALQVRLDGSTYYIPPLGPA